MLESAAQWRDKGLAASSMRSMRRRLISRPVARISYSMEIAVVCSSKRVIEE